MLQCCQGWVHSCLGSRNAVLRVGAGSENFLLLHATVIKVMKNHAVSSQWMKQPHFLMLRQSKNGSSLCQPPHLPPQGQHGARQKGACLGIAESEFQRQIGHGTLSCCLVDDFTSLGLRVWGDLDHLEDPFQGQLLWLSDHQIISSDLDEGSGNRARIWTAALAEGS